MEEFVENETFSFGEQLNNEEMNFETNNNFEENNYQEFNSFENDLNNNTNISFDTVPQENIEPVKINLDLSAESIDSNDVVNVFDNTSIISENVQDESNNIEQLAHEKYGATTDNKEKIIENPEFQVETNFDNTQEEVISENVDELNNVISEENVIDNQNLINTPFQNEFAPESVDSQNIDVFSNEVASLEDSVINEETSNISNEKNIDYDFLETDEVAFGILQNNEPQFEEVQPIMESNDSFDVVNNYESSNIISDTSIEELNKLTEYEEEKIDPTNIRALFSKVGGNVKEASEIFIKNAEMKDKIDAKVKELKKLQIQLEESKKAQYEEINAYKEEVYGKLTEKKEEIENRINKLKEFQEKLEEEKEEFEKYKRLEKEQIEKVQKEVQDAYDSRREELNHIEDVLRKQKDALDEERSQLSLDRIQYESDKNELANNLLKFNEIVDSFTNGMDKLGNEG